MAEPKRKRYRRRRSKAPAFKTKSSKQPAGDPQNPSTLPGASSPKPHKPPPPAPSPNVVDAAVQATAVAVHGGATGQTHAQASEAAAQAYQDAISSPPVSPERAAYRARRQRYRKAMLQVRATEKTIAKMKKDDPARKDSREVLRDLLKSKDTRKPEKPLSVVAEDLARKARHTVDEVKRHPAKAIAAATGKKTSQVRADVAQFARAARKQKDIFKHGSPREQRAKKAVRRAYKAADPQKRAKLRKAGLAPGPTMAEDVASRVEANAGKQRFVRQRQRQRPANRRVFAAYSKQMAADEVLPALKRAEEARGRKLRPQEVRDITHRALSDLSERGERQALRQSQKALEHIGAVPEQGQRFYRLAREAAEFAPGKKTRRIAKKFLARRAEDQSNLERGKITRRHNRPAFVTPQMIEKQTQAKLLADYEARADAKVDTVGELASRFWTEVKGIPKGTIESIKAGAELVQGNPERAKAMLSELGRTDPAYGFFKSLAEGQSVGDAWVEAAHRSTESPLSMATDITAIGGAARALVGRAAHGTGKHAVETARPHFKLEDRRAAGRYKRMTPRERLRETSRRRAGFRAETAKRNKRARAQAKSQGGKRGEHFEPIPTKAGEERQFYSRSTPVRAVQKAKETVAAARGRDPFTATGRQATKRFTKRANLTVRRLRAANLRLGAEVSSDLGKTVGRSSKAFKLAPKASAKGVAAFELAYDGSVRRGSIDGDLAALEREFDSQGTPTGDANAAMVRELRANPKIVEKAIEPAQALRKRGVELDDALVQAGHISQEVADRRRAVAGPIARGEAKRVEKGDVLPGEAERVDATRAEARVGRAIGKVRDLEEGIKKAAKDSERLSLERQLMVAKDELNAAQREREYVMSDASAAGGAAGALADAYKGVEQAKRRAFRAADESVTEDPGDWFVPETPGEKGHSGDPGADVGVEEAVDQVVKRRRELFKQARERGMQPVKAGRAGWAWITPEKLGQMIEAGDHEGAFVDYEAGLRGRGTGSEDLTRETVGQLHTDEPIKGRVLGSDRVRASLEGRARLLGLVRLKRQLIEISPVKRALTQDEAAAFIARANKKGEVEYVAIPAGHGGPLEDGAFGPEFVGRAPAKGEAVYVVPKAVVKVFDQVTRERGRFNSGLNYLSQKYVSAVLPFSVLWHAGNAIDLMTRLIVSGTNPFADPLLARALRQALEAKDPVWGAEVYEHLRGHFGSRESVLDEASLAKAVRAGKSGFSKSAADFLDRMNTREMRKFFPVRQATQAGFNAATALERPLVGAAMGRAARTLAQDLGVELADHAALAKRLADSMFEDKALVEEFGRRTVEIVGDYSANADQLWLQGIDPFWSWVREANKFVLYTFPAKHPVVFALNAMAANMAWDSATRLGLTDYGDGSFADLTGFLANAFPGGMPGWFRPTSPFTSFGETAKMLDDPISYILGRPLPYAQKAIAPAMGHRMYWSPAVRAAEKLQEALGIELPGFKGESQAPITAYTGSKAKGFLGALVESFVPGANPVYSGLLEGGFPDATSNIFDPSPIPGTTVPWWENRALNPFGRVKDLEYQYPDDPKAAQAQKKAERESQGRKANETTWQNGDVIYDEHGRKMVWSGGGFVPAKDAPKVDGKTTKGVKTNPGRAAKKEAIAKLEKQFPQINAGDPRSLEAIAEAARKYDVPPEILASIYGIETANGTTDLPGLAPGTENSAGAGGPMQFIASTWDQYGVDGNGDGKADRWDTVDAIYSAANYLSASGVQEDPRAAIFSYNHADWYVDEVLTDAQALRSHQWDKAGVGAALAPSNDPNQVHGAWGGSRRKVLQMIPEAFRDEGRHDKRTPEENAAVGGATNSDHLTTNELAYAADLPVDAELYATLRERLGLPPAATGEDSVTIDGYRYQLIYGSQYGHGDHIHLGATWTGDSAPAGTVAGGPAIDANLGDTSLSSYGSSSAPPVLSGGGPMTAADQAAMPAGFVPAPGAAVKRRRHRRGLAYAARMEVALSLLRGDIDVVDFVTALSRGGQA